MNACGKKAIIVRSIRWVLWQLKSVNVGSAITICIKINFLRLLGASELFTRENGLENCNLCLAVCSIYLSFSCYCWYGCLWCRVPMDLNCLRVVDCISLLNSRSKHFRSRVAYQILVICFDNKVMHFLLHLSFQTI